MNITTKVLPPTMPDHIVLELLPTTKQQGINFNSGKIDIKDLNEEQALEYAELMKSTFIDHWRKKVNRK